jgi:hypothetical protein
VPFLGDDVQEGRTLEVLDHVQVLAQQRDVVPVDRPEVSTSCCR